MFALYSGVSPKGIESYVRIVAADTGRLGYAIMMTAPQGDYSSITKDLDQIEQSFSLAAGQPPPGDANGQALPPDARAYLGIRYVAITPEIARENNLGQVRGLLIDEVIPDGPAAKGGLLQDDVLLELNGKPVTNTDEYRQMLGTMTPGTRVRLNVLRAGRQEEFQIMLAAPPPNATQPAPGPATPSAPGTKPAPQPGRGTEAGAPRAATPSSGTLRLRPYSVMDNMLGGEAVRPLVPVGWRVEGGVTWKFCPAAPAGLTLRIYNPDGVEEIGIFPDIVCSFSPALASTIPPGQLYFGAEVLPPILDPIQCLRMMILPRYQPNLRTAAVVAEEELPQVAAAILQNNPELSGGATARAGKIRLEYQQSGRAVHEDLYGAVVVAQSQAGTVWMPSELHYSKAEKGRLEEQYKLFQTIIYSMQPRLEWYNKYLQIAQMMVQSQNEQTQRWADVSQYIARANNEITEMRRKSFQDRQTTLDRVNARWDQHIRGVNSTDSGVPLSGTSSNSSWIVVI